VSGGSQFYPEFVAFKLELLDEVVVVGRLDRNLVDPHYQSPSCLVELGVDDRADIYFEPLGLGEQGACSSLRPFVRTQEEADPLEERVWE
jgi:hypothetical protein